jgi:ribosomal protein S12 methylthiotransferase accessory factor
MTTAHQGVQSLGDPKFPIYCSDLGDLDQLTLLKDHNFGRPMPVSGAGSDYDNEVAITKCYAETLERYCSCVFDERQFIIATPAELGHDAMDIRLVPKCSDAEIASGKSLLRKPPAQDEKIRWVRGISLTTGKRTWIPAVMVYLHIPYMDDSERFVSPISTGCAIHMTYEKALINGINEVIERDAIALTWLQKLPLPQLKFDDTLSDMVKKGPTPKLMDMVKSLHKGLQ